MKPLCIVWRSYYYLLLNRKKSRQRHQGINPVAVE